MLAIRSYAAPISEPRLRGSAGTFTRNSVRPLIQVEISLIAVGVLLWLINSLPMAASIKSILNAVVIIAVVVWLLKLLGVL
jgi:hypothetical protein